MLCKIAELLVEVPEVGDLPQRCEAYLAKEPGKADIVIREADFQPERWEGVSYNLICYMESARLFYWELLRFQGMMLHASAVEFEGRSYLFSGPSTVGKSTHTGLWKEILGQGVETINDDKPALRYIDGTWYAYGTPWCGKDGINLNRKAPLAGICFLKQSKQIVMSRLSAKDAMIRIIHQSARKMPEPELMTGMLMLVDTLVRDIPVYELENTPTQEAARLCYETLRASAPC
ncbi:MAG: hypothetical protein J6Q54_01930 [Oscillospiraceae bacterium]|nr:hypothetical protein [Oscillospiraceae bacterium]